MSHVQRRHFNTTARKVGYGDSAEPIIMDILARTPAAVAEVSASLPVGFSQRVADSVLGGLEEAARKLQAVPSA